MTLDEIPIGHSVAVEHVGGERAFRRRLMELGLVPGTQVTLLGVAPLGDPLQFVVRGASLSIRRGEARQIRIAPQPIPAEVVADTPVIAAHAGTFPGP